MEKKDYVVEFETRTYLLAGSFPSKFSERFTRGFLATDILDCQEQARKYIEKKDAKNGINSSFTSIVDIRSI